MIEVKVKSKKSEQVLITFDPLEIKAYHAEGDHTRITLDGKKFIDVDVPYEQFQLIMNGAGVPTYNRYK